MEKSKHTKGPWRFARVGKRPAWEYVENICLVTRPNRTSGPPTEEEAEANANLIVAAPDLLEAARHALRMVRIGASDIDEGSERDFWMDVENTLSEAIAKAEAK